MSKSVVVRLSTPIEGHHGPIAALEFREPRWDEVMTFGEPFRVHQFEGGEPFVHVNYEVLKSYAEACLTGAETDPLVTLSRLGVKDARKVADAIAGFFQPDPEEGAGSTT